MSDEPWMFFDYADVHVIYNDITCIMSHSCLSWCMYHHACVISPLMGAIFYIDELWSISSLQPRCSGCRDDAGISAYHCVYVSVGIGSGLGSNTYLYLQIQIQIQIRRICICICIWSNFKPCICICICIWSTVFGVFDKYVFKHTCFLGRFLNTSLWNTNLHEYSL